MQSLITSACACAGANLPRFVQPVLLAIVAQKPCHGYSILRELAQSCLFAECPPDIAGVYRILKNMEREGSLVSQWDSPENGPARKLYTITERGQLCLKTWQDTLIRHQKFLKNLQEFVANTAGQNV